MSLIQSINTDVLLEEIGEALFFFFYSVTFKQQLFDCFVYKLFNIQCLIYDYDKDYCYRCISSSNVFSLKMNN